MIRRDILLSEFALGFRLCYPGTIREVIGLIGSDAAQPYQLDRCEFQISRDGYRVLAAFIHPALLRTINITSFINAMYPL